MTTTTEPTEAQRLVQRDFLTHASLIHGFIYSLYPCAEAEDLVHEVFLVATAKAESFRQGTDFLAWVRAIARYKVLEKLRAVRRAPSMLSQEAVEGLADRSDALFTEWEERSKALRKCLPRLSPRARQMVELKYGEGRTLKQIAADIGWSVKAVKVGLGRARKVLRDCVALQLGGA